ncbi:MAG: hypothetical protein ACXWQQ_04845 [Pseudobdellovibrio sp.]
MKKALFAMVVCLSTVVLAATEKSDNLSTISETSKVDANKIVQTSEGPQLATQVKKADPKKKKPIVTAAKSTKTEDEDFKRLEQELDSLNK